MDTNILLESGTNELEVLEFTIAGNHYGINVAKVREILPMAKITPVPNSHPCIEGIFMPRDVIITAINLVRALGFPENPNQKSDMLIITNFNNLNIAFDVEQVLGIHRVSWTDIVKPDATVNAPGAGIATGIIKKTDSLIIVLDFERIVEEICPETSLKMSELAELGERERNNIPILFAEDSPMLQSLVADALAQLKHIPIIVFSSLINDDMKRKGEKLGADAQISKPEIGQLVTCIDNLVVNGVDGNS